MGEVNPAEETSIESRIEAALFGSDDAEQAADEPQAAPVVAEEAEVDKGPDTEAETADDTEDEQETRFESIYDFAAALDQDPDEFLKSIKAKVKIDGEESEVTLAELQAGYQKDADYRRKTAAFSQERAQFVQQVEQQAKALQNLGNAYEQAFMADYQSIDWARLQQDDPVEFAQRYPAFQARYQQVQQIKQQAQQAEQMAWQERQPLESAKMLQLIPEWTDPAVKHAGQREIMQLLESEGASQSIYNAANTDATAMKLLYDLVQLRKEKQRVSEPKTQKKVVSKKTSILKPGPRQSQSDKQRSNAEKLRAKLRKTGSRADAEALLLERMR